MSAAKEAAARALSGSLSDAMRRRALALLVQSAGRLGDAERLRELSDACREDPWLACQLAREFVRLGDSAEATRCIGQLPEPSALELEVRGELASLQAALALNAGDYSEQLRHWQAALWVYEQLGMRNTACATRGEIGFCQSLLGDFLGANASIEAAFREADERGYAHVRAWLLCIWGPVLGELGELARAIEVERAALDAFAAGDDPRLSGACWAYLGQLYLKAGEPEQALESALRAEALLEAYPPLFGLALAALGRAAVMLGDRAAAARCEQRARELFEAGTEFEEGRVLLQLVRCELCEALGRDAQAADLAREAAAELEERAQAIASEAARKQFLTQVAEHRALLDWADAATERPRSDVSSGDTARSGS